MDVTFNASFAASLQHQKQVINSGQILGLPLNLQFGDLKRMLGVASPFYEFQASNMTIGVEGVTAGELAATVEQSIDTLKSAIAHGEAIRVWRTDNADDYCGFVWLCDLLKGTKVTLTQIHVPTKLPQYTINRSAELYTIQHLGELIPENISDILPKEITVSTASCLAYSYEWQAILRQNSAVRVLINGELISAPETFYDWMILARMKQKPTSFVQRIRLMGDIVGHYPVAVPDWWWHARINTLTEA